MDNLLDVVIAGGGPVGSILALTLHRSGQRVRLLDARPPSSAVQDDRAIALSHGSRLILERLGAWASLANAATPIKHVVVTQQRGFGRVELEASDAKVPALGYVVAYSDLQQTLTTILAAQGVPVDSASALKSVEHAPATVIAVTNADERLGARLLVIADGGKRSLREPARTRDYRQSAIVCNVASTLAHHNRAFERFTPDGPLALLPCASGWSLIWTTSTRSASDLMQADDDEFCRLLGTAFGNSVGYFHTPRPRGAFALALRIAPRTAIPRTVLIGNAAQTLHPVAGQGLNLGLRDAWELARHIITNESQDPGEEKFLKTFHAQRRCDQTATILFTDSLIQLFCKDIPPLSVARSCGLAMLSAHAPAKNFLTRRMMFGARG